MWSPIWHHHFHMAPQEWWHMSPIYDPLGPTKCQNLLSRVLPYRHIMLMSDATVAFSELIICCNVYLSKPIICFHVYLVETNQMSPHVLLKEREKGPSALVFAMKSFVNLHRCSSVVLNTIRTFTISQLLKGLQLRSCASPIADLPMCRCFDVWFPPISEVATIDLLSLIYQTSNYMRCANIPCYFDVWLSISDAVEPSICDLRYHTSDIPSFLRLESLKLHKTIYFDRGVHFWTSTYPWKACSEHFPMERVWCKLRVFLWIGRLLQTSLLFCTLLTTENTFWSKWHHNPNTEEKIWISSQLWYNIIVIFSSQITFLCRLIYF